MAHSDWVNSSSRVIKAKAVARVYDSFSANFEIGMQGESLNTDYNGNCYITVGCSIVGNSNNGLKYLQITGNKERNEYPIDFTITNSRYYQNTGEDLFEKNIVNNNSTDCIIDFKEYLIPIEFDIIVIKWSKPNITLQEDSITFVGPSINFDLIECGMLSNFETDIGLPYDGTNQLQYGMKTSSNSIELTKDLKNTGVQKLPLTDSMFANFEYGKKYTFGWNDNTQEKRTWSDKIVEDGIAGIIDCVDDNYNSTSGTYLTGALGGQTRSTNNRNVKQNHIYFNACSLNSNVYYLTSGNTKNYVTKNMRVRFSYGDDSHDEFVYDTTKNNNNQFYYYSSYYKYTYTPDPTNPTALEVRANVIYGQITNDRRYYYNVRIANILMLDLTDVFGEGNEPTKEWCDSNIVYNSITGVLTISGKSYIVGNDIKIITRSELLTRLEYKPYIEFSMALDSEFNYTKIGNYFIDSFDYEENNPKFTAKLKDNTKLLEETKLSGVAVNDINNNKGDTSGPFTHKSMNILFNSYINNALTEDTGLSFGEWGDWADIEVKTATYPQNYPYSYSYNKYCQIFGTYLIQNITDIHNVKIVYIGDDNNNSYSISKDKCLSFEQYNKLDNSIRNTSIEAQEFELNNTGNVIQYAGYNSVYSTRTEGYINLNKLNESYEDTEIHNSASSDYPYIVSKLNSSGNVISGTITIPLSQYNDYQDFSIDLYGVRAKYTCEINLSWITGQTGVPSGTNDETKNYIKSDGSIVTSISSLTDDDFNKIKWGITSYTITRDDYNAYLNYTITFKRINDIALNSDASYGILPAVSIEEYFLGAYKVVLIGYNYSSKSTTFNYTSGQGNTYSLQGNEFLQLNCKYIESGTTYSNAPLVYDKIADKILTEFKDNKSIVKLEWIGSPYIKIFDIVTLDNGISYRVHYIRHKYDGGYRQVLYLVQED